MIIDFEYSNYNATGNEACKINITSSNEISHVKRVGRAVKTIDINVQVLLKGYILIIRIIIPKKNK